MQEMKKTWVQSLGQEDPLEQEMATLLQSSGLGNPMDRGAWRATVPGVAESHRTEQTHHTHTCLKIQAQAVTRKRIWP